MVGFYAQEVITNGRAKEPLLMYDVNVMVVEFTIIWQELKHGEIEMILKDSCFSPVEIDIDDPKVGVRDCGGDLQSLHNWPSCRKFTCLKCGAEIHYDKKHQGIIVRYVSQ